MRVPYVKRFLSLLLATVVVLSTMPFTAFATEIQETIPLQAQDNGSTENTGFDADLEESVEESSKEISDEEESVEESDKEISDEEESVEESNKEISDEEESVEESDKEISNEETSVEESDKETSSVETKETSVAENEDSTENQLFQEDEAVTDGDSSIAFMSVDGFVSETHDVFSRTTTTIAPGVTQDICYAYAKDGKQMVYYVATADVTRDDVIVQSSYLKQHEDNVLGMAKLTEQIAYANQKYTNKDDPLYISDYYNVVAGVNASFYNMTTGQPMGITFIDGVSFGTNNYDNFFAILNDGKTAVIDYASNLDNYVDDEGNSTIWQAAAGSQWLVRDGQDVTAGVTGSYNTDRHSRTCVGITEDGKVVLMTLDGRQEPFSCGGSMHELAQIMLEAGCVAAINLDGGGSATYAARQAGSDSVKVINRPSDGSERSISAGLIVASTAVPSDVFSSAVLTAESDYVTPNSVVDIAAVGVSPAGTSAEIPEDIIWQLADETLGTVEKGVFTSNGTVGDAVVQMVYEGNVVGETIIHVVVPDSIAFDSETITVPYGKTVTLEISATYGLNEVALKDGDISFGLSNEEMGVISGFAFTACEESSDLSDGQITAVLMHNKTITCTANVNFGKGSEAVMDFENADISNMSISTGYPQYGPTGANGQNEVGHINVVTAANGKVHDGEYALAVECDYSQAYETGYHMLNLTGLNISVPANAQAIGMWIYLPELEELSTTSMRFTGATEGSTTADVSSPWLWDNCEPYGWENDGWRYVTMDLTGYAKNLTIQTLQLYICDRDNTNVGFYFKDNASVNGHFTYYIDSITIDYSSAVDDREPPIFTSVRYANEGMSDAVELDGQTSTYNTLSFGAVVKEDTVKGNDTGLDNSTAKAYIDGLEVSCTCTGGIISVSDVVLADGPHTVRFEICDKMGNMAYVERQIVVSAGSEMTNVSLVPANPEADKILIGSLYWMNLMASNIEDIQAVTANLNLNSVSSWELDHMNVAEGFTATYKVDEVTNNATITITRTGISNATGEAILAELPIRTWVSKLTEYAGYEDQTPTKLWSRKIIWPMDIKLNVKLGEIEFIDGSTGSFSMTPVEVLTELYGNYAELNADGDYSNKTSWHVHTETALEDKAATCTENGYKGRTYCEICDSVVDWGTTIPVAGHSYNFVDDLLKCTVCGDLFNGEWTDGKSYVDGIVVSDGWIGDSYYVNGEKLTGIQQVDGYYYNFGEDGICTKQTKYTGFINDETGVRYAQIGVLATGWKDIDDNYYYFYSDGYAETESMVYYAGQPYYFDDSGKLISGFWYDDGLGTKYYYGPSYYNHEWAEIDGNTYYFDSNGHRLEGWNCIIESGTNPPQWYQFDENGVLLLKLTSTGLFEANGQLYYTENGISQYGLIFAEDGYYYYFKSSNYAAVKDCTYWVSRPNDTGIPAGSYEFDTQGRMVIETKDVKDGIVEEDGVLHYYENGEKVYAGLILIDGDYYYINSSCKVVTTSHYWVNKTNDLLPAGFYDFAADGKMIVEKEEDSGEEVKNGIVEEDGVLYYYENGEKTYAGLILIDGDYYYINSSCKVVTTSHYWVNKTNDLLPAGFYDFATDGKMIVEKEEDSGEEVKNGIVEEDGVLYYYEDGEKTYAGLILIDGDYYYINSSCKVVTTSHYWVNKTNDLLPAGFYDFATDGKMIQ